MLNVFSKRPALSRIYPFSYSFSKLIPILICFWKLNIIKNLSVSLKKWKWQKIDRLWHNFYDPVCQKHWQQKVEQPPNDITLVRCVALSCNNFIMYCTLPVKSLDTPCHLMIFLYFHEFKLYVLTEGIQTMNEHTKLFS